MQTLKLQDYGVMPMTNFEAAEIDGGGIDWKVVVAIYAVVASEWNDAKAGFVKGWNDFK